MKILLFIISLFTFFQLQAQTNLRKAEWFINTDPGFHNATHINFAPNGDEVEWEFNLNNLDVGVHYLGVRVQDEAGIWSHTLTRAFLVLPPAQPGMTYAEWYIDEDPGFRRANPVPIIADTATWEIDLSGLEVGVHYLHVRTQQASGGWTHTLTRAFLVAEEGESPIERIDYSYTDERGEALQFSYTLDVAQHYIDLDFEPDTTGLIGGEEYELCFSVVTVNGARSDERCLNFEAEGIPSFTNDIEHQAQISLYPNPTIDHLTVDFPELTQVQVWAIIDANGRTRSRQTIRQSTQQLQLNVKDLESGYYTLVIETQNVLMIRNIIVQ